MESNEVKQALADELLSTLWVKGLLSDSEREKVHEKVAESLSLKKIQFTSGRNA